MTNSGIVEYMKNQAMRVKNRMKSLRKLGLASAVVAITGCSAMPPQSEQEPEVMMLTEQRFHAQAEQEPVSANLPRLALSGQLLYQLLVAEFAVQQGELHLAAQAYLTTAYETRDPRLASRATRMAVYARDLGMALQAARLWVELEPEQIEARQSLAALLLRHEQPDEALQHMHVLIELAPKGKGQGFMLLSNMLSQESDHAQALGMMGEVVERHQDEPLARYALAHLANRLHQYPEALHALETLLQDEPDMLDALVLKARVYHALGDEEAALVSMGEAVRRHRDNDQVRLIYARMLVDAQRLPEAREQFQWLQRSQPDDSDVVYALALLALEAGELDEAEGHFMRLLSLGVRDEESRVSLAQIAEQQGQVADAIEWYQSVGPDADRYMDAQIHAARLLQRHQDLDAALDYLRGLSLHNQQHIAQRYQGEAELLSSAGELALAMEVYDEAVALFQDNANLLYGRALLAERMDRLDQAEADLRLILENEPEHAHALNALGYTLVDRTERYEEGLRYIKRAYRMLPNDPAILDSMGWAYYRLERLEEAEDYLRRAYQIQPDAEIGAHLGEVLWVQGREEAARAIWREASELDAAHPVLLETIERLQP